MLINKDLKRNQNELSILKTLHLALPFQISLLFTTVQK